MRLGVSTGKKVEGRLRLLVCSPLLDSARRETFPADNCRLQLPTMVSSSLEEVICIQRQGTTGIFRQPTETPLQKRRHRGTLRITELREAP